MARSYLDPNRRTAKTRVLSGSREPGRESFWQRTGNPRSVAPIETCSESLSDQRSRGRVIAAGSNVYVLQEFDAVVLGDALHQDFRVGILAHESTVGE